MQYVPMECCLVCANGMLLGVLTTYRNPSTWPNWECLRVG